MPTYSSTPRGGTQRRGGSTLTTTRRGGYRSPITGQPQRGFFARGGAAETLREAGELHVGPGPAFTPIKALLDTVSFPSYALGNIIAGDPIPALKNIAGLGHWGRKQTPSTSLRQYGLMPGGAAGTVLGLGLDIATDPLTYVSFGVGPALKGVAAAGRTAAAKAVEEAARPTLRQIGARAAAREVELADVPSTFKFRLRVPFTRGRELLVSESEAIPRAAARATARLRRSESADMIQRGFATSRGVNKIVNQVYQDLRRAANSETRGFAKAAARLERDIVQAEKRVGIARGEGASAISRALDNPARYDVPDGLEEVAQRSREMLDELHRLEREAGIDYTGVEHYVPHMGASRADRRAVAAVYAKPTAALYDEPFFVKPRDARDLDEFTVAGERHGFTPETNIARLIERRARASVNTRMKKALDDSVHEATGVKPPPMEVPSTFAEQLALEAERGYLNRLLERRPTAPAQAAAASARQQEVEARQALAAARQTGDPQAVAAARAQFDEATAARRSEPVRVASSAAARAVPEYQRLQRDVLATQATLPPPTAGRYRPAIEQRKAESRVRAAAIRARAKAKRARVSVQDDLAQRVAAMRRILEREAQGRPEAGSIVQGQYFGLGREDNWYTRAIRSELKVKEVRGARVIKKGKRKGKVQRAKAEYRDVTPEELEEMYLAGLRRAEANGEALDATERRILKAMDVHAGENALADEAMTAIAEMRSGLIDPAEGAGPDRRAGPARQPRDRHARPPRPQRTALGRARGGRRARALPRGPRAMARYFTPEGTGRTLLPASPPTGFVRLYRGESRLVEGGNWWSPSERVAQYHGQGMEARTEGGIVYAVDVPVDVFMRARGSTTASRATAEIVPDLRGESVIEVQLPAEYRSRAVPIARGGSRGPGARPGVLDDRPVPFEDILGARGGSPAGAAGPGPAPRPGTLAEQAEAVRSGAQREVEQAIAKADRRVEVAERRLKKAQKAGSTSAIKAARNRLTRARQIRQEARLALERERASFVGTPRPGGPPDQEGRQG